MEGNSFLDQGEETMQKKIIQIMICLLAFILAGTFYCLKLRKEAEAVWDSGSFFTEAADDEGDRRTVQEQEETLADRKIYVHICGEVKKPGVYEVAEGSRVYELLALAGGATEAGVPDAMNLADILTDGERIVIPTESEAAALLEEDMEKKQTLVNLNTASLQQLMTLPGIGEAKAADIIQYRETNGNFNEITDIMKISGIKEALFEKIKSLITV